MTKKSSNSNLHRAAKVKNDEFYTQLTDIENEIKYYKDQFMGKVVYCNCDDPFESNFFKYFASNFKALKLKRLIATSYKPSPIANTQLGLFGDDKTLEPIKGRLKTNANKLIINEVNDLDGDGAFDLRDIAEQLKANKNNEWSPMEGDGDFRSPESIELLKQADIVVTNPPFSLFREYVEQLIKYQKKFLIIGNDNARKYQDIFKLIQENKLWPGYGRAKEFIQPNGTIKKFGNIGWFTNLDVAKRHQFLTLYKKYSKEEFFKYDNYDAIEVSKVSEIPMDYEGIMGVPITFLDKYNPSQFEILGMSDNRDPNYEYRTKLYTEEDSRQYNDLNRGTVIKIKGELKSTYTRLLIKAKK